MDINKITAALNMLTSAIAEAGHDGDCELSVNREAFRHIEHEMMSRTSGMSGSLGPTGGLGSGMRTIEFRTYTSRVSLYEIRGPAGISPRRKLHDEPDPLSMLVVPPMEPPPKYAMKKPYNKEYETAEKFQREIERL